jgi:hypothetical protein
MIIAQRFNVGYSPSDVTSPERDGRRESRIQVSDARELMLPNRHRTTPLQFSVPWRRNVTILRSRELSV